MKTEEFRKHDDISLGRKLMFYGGMALSVIGFALFLIPFFSVIRLMGDIHIGINGLTSPVHSFIWAFIGMGLVVAGQILRSAGAKGLAGSGVILAPERARDELSPYSKAVGGMVHDAVSGFRQEGGRAEDLERTKVMIRCPDCRALNDENAKFCNQCGQAL